MTHQIKIPAKNTSNYCIEPHAVFDKQRLELDTHSSCENARKTCKGKPDVSILVSAASSRLISDE